MGRIVSGAAALIAIGMAGAPLAVQAQYYDGGYDRPYRDGYGSRGGYDGRDGRDGYDDRGRRGYDGYRGRGGYDGYDRGYGRPSFGGICETTRGSCRTRPAPLDAPCDCDIPGFGYKRGGVVR
jgi:hypothetical protein